MFQAKMSREFPKSPSTEAMLQAALRGKSPLRSPLRSPRSASPTKRSSRTPKTPVHWSAGDGTPQPKVGFDLDGVSRAEFTAIRQHVRIIFTMKIK